MFRESYPRERICEKAAKLFEFRPGIRTGWVRHFLNHKTSLSQWYHSQRSSHGSWVGHRGFARRPSWCGPREPPLPWAGHPQGKVFTLFIDGIPKWTTWYELRKVFSVIGVVVDSYISKKQRKNKKVNFGFIRFYNREDAVMAVKRLNGHHVFGSKLHVSMAKYQKDGTSVSRNISAVNKVKACPVKHLSLQASRRYSDVVVDKKKNVQATSTSPVTSTLNTSEKSDGDNMVKPMAFEVNSEILPQMETVPTDFGSSSKDSQSVRVEILTVAQSVGSASVVDGDPATENNDCVKFDLGTVHLDVLSNSVDIDKASATPEQLGPVAMGDIGIKRSCRPRNLKKIMNTRDIANFLGYYGPTKA
ncbi:unnamed protein product [Amaranthus hypochondriacus]